MSVAEIAVRVEAIPFPHCMIDDTISPERVRAINAEWPTAGWTAHNHKHSQKAGCSEWGAFGPETRRLITSLNDASVSAEIGELFGIDGLVSDPLLFGGGLHESVQGGFLDIHADFNIHPETQLARRLNLLLFLNEGWKAEWGGAMELWGAECQVRIQPEAGRSVLFAANDTSFHGHPERLSCPAGRSRRSIALYYYSPVRAGETLRSHSTLYRGEEATWFEEAS